MATNRHVLQGKLFTVFQSCLNLANELYSYINIYTYDLLTVYFWKLNQITYQFRQLEKRKTVYTNPSNSKVFSCALSNYASVTLITKSSKANWFTKYLITASNRPFTTSCHTLTLHLSLYRTKKAYIEFKPYIRLTKTCLNTSQRWHQEWSLNV